jgi:hypothetical protein
VARVLGRDARVRYKYDAVTGYAKSKLTEFRTEERRKVGLRVLCNLHDYLSVRGWVLTAVLCLL